MRFSPSVHLKISACFQKTGFRSVVGIMFALHAKAPRFKTEQKQLFPFEEKYEHFALSVALTQHHKGFAAKRDEDRR